MGLIWLVIGLVVGVAGGWYLKGRFGAKVATDLQAVSDTAKKL